MSSEMPPRGSHMRWVILGLLALPLGAIAACTLNAYRADKAFDEVAIGDSEARVIERFGSRPSVRERSGSHFTRYADQACQGVCTERLWFENRLSLDTQAWSVELDADHRVIRKTRWTSP